MEVCLGLSRELFLELSLELFLELSLSLSLFRALFRSLSLGTSGPFGDHSAFLLSRASEALEFSYLEEVKLRRDALV